MIVKRELTVGIFDRVIGCIIYDTDALPFRDPEPQQLYRLWPAR